MRSSHWRIVSLCAFVLCLAWPAFAQTADSRIEELERQVAALKAEIEAMKEGQAEEPGTDRISELERKLEVLAQEIEKLRIGEAAVEPDESTYGFGPAASKIYRSERGLSIGGYGELIYKNTQGEEAEEEDEGLLAEDEEEEVAGDSFDLQRAVLYFGYKFNDHWLLNSEVEFEHAGGEIGVEFAYIDYLWRPQANFRAGLVLLPMGFINELHEPTVFLGANRPDVEKVILPSTWRENGVGLFGNAGPFSYRTYVVNGLDASGFTEHGLSGGRQEFVEAKAEDLAWVGRVDFTGLPGLLVGGSAYLGDSGQNLEPAVGTEIVEGHLEWKWRGLEFRALGVQASLDDVADLNRILELEGEESIGEKMTGYYLQLGYDVLAGRGDRSLTPYARWETYNTQDEVPAGFEADPENDVESLTLGLAFKPIDQIILKVDHQSYDNAEGTGVDRFNVLLGWIF
jgi:hypothetical protein